MLITACDEGDKAPSDTTSTSADSAEVSGSDAPDAAETSEADTTLPLDTGSPLETTPDDTAVDDTIVDDTTVDDTTVADTTVNDTTVADTTVDDTTVDDTAVADTTPADTTPADTTVADTTVADTTVADTTPTDTGADKVTFDEVHPIFAAKCGPCHVSSVGVGSGGHKIGQADVGLAYTDSQKKAAFYLACVNAGLTKGACALVRIRDGSMPFARGCTGDPAKDAANASCLTAAQQAAIQQWIDDGQLAPP